MSIIRNIIISLGFMSVLLSTISCVQKKQEGESPYSCNVKVKEEGSIKTFRTSGAFIFQSQGEEKVNAIETAVSFKIDTTSGTDEKILLLSTYTLTTKNSWPVMKATFKLADKSVIVLTTEEHIEGTMNEKVNMTGNFFNLNEDNYTKLSNNAVQEIILETQGDSVRIKPSQKIINSQLNCAFKESKKQ